MLKFSTDVKLLNGGDKSGLFEKLNLGVEDILKCSEKLSPEKANNYIANDDALLKLSEVTTIGESVFNQKIQAGWCYGGGKSMNGVEWHESPEVVVACTDAVLLLGDYEDVADETYDSKKAVALFLKQGEAVRLSARTLHLAPLAVNEFFKAAIILPEGTNLPLPDGIKGTHRAINKWLLVHPDNKKGIDGGGKIGVYGDNITLL